MSVLLMMLPPCPPFPPSLPVPYWPRRLFLNSLPVLLQPRRLCHKTFMPPSSSALSRLASFVGSPAAQICIGLPVCQLCPGVSTPWLHLKLLCPSLHLGPSTSWLHPGSLLPQVGSTWNHHPHGSIGLPSPSGSTLVSCRFAYTTDFWAVLCASSLQPFNSVGLLLPNGSASVLSHTGSSLVLQHPGFTSTAHHHGSALI